MKPIKITLQFFDLPVTIGISWEQIMEILLAISAQTKDPRGKELISQLMKWLKESAQQDDIKHEVNRKGDHIH